LTQQTLLLITTPKANSHSFKKGKTKENVKLRICLFTLEEFENSKYVLEKGLKFSNEYEKQIKRWIRKCNLELESKKKENQPTIRFNWYQTQSSVVISLVVKNKKEEDAILKFSPNSFYANVKEGNENLIKEFDFYEEINPEKVKINYFSSKIEVSLEKKNQSMDWAQLEKGKEEKPKVFDPKKYVSVQKKKDWNELNNKFKEEEEKEIPKGDAGKFNLIFKPSSNEHSFSKDLRFRFRRDKESNDEILYRI
jgi:suppressor of G2 allele of SKP1